MTLIGEALAASDRVQALGKWPPYWANASVLPPPGCRCAIYGGRSWWSNRGDFDEAVGWACEACHPPEPGSAVNRVESIPCR